MAKRIAQPRTDFRSTRDDGPIVPGSERLPPPDELRAVERKIWAAITARMPADWFTADTSPLLKQFCRHIALADGLMVEIGALEQELETLRGSPEPDRKRTFEVKEEMHVLMRLHGFESDRIANIGTKLRLTNQSRYRAEVAKDQHDTRAASGAPGPKPWENWAKTPVN